MKKNSVRIILKPHLIWGFVQILTNKKQLRHTRPQGYKTFFVLNSTEHEIFPALNVKMPTIVGILAFMSRKYSILGLSEPKKGRIS